MLQHPESRVSEKLATLLSYSGIKKFKTQLYIISLYISSFTTFTLWTKETMYFSKNLLDSKHGLEKNVYYENFSSEKNKSK